MERADPTKLRRAPENKGAETRKKDRLEMEEFLKNWQFHLRTPGTEWGEPRAVAQLQRKEMLKFLLCEENTVIKWQAGDLFGRMLYEMKEYRHEARAGLIKKYYDDVDKFLKNEVGRIKKQEDREDISELRSLLEDLRKRVEQTRKTADGFKKRKKDWHSGVWQRRWPGIKRNNLVSRKIELDTRLQIELGKMLADYLGPQGVSLETIARLILLAYLAGGLCAMDGEVLRTLDTGRELKVRNIRDNLREIKLHKAASYKRS